MSNVVREMEKIDTIFYWSRNIEKAACEECVYVCAREDFMLESVSEELKICELVEYVMRFIFKPK